MNPLLSIAHRGYSARFPENTRLAFEGAIGAGADYIEVDARLSADSQVICCHDADLTRLTEQDVEEILDGINAGEG